MSFEPKKRKFKAAQIEYVLFMGLISIAVAALFASLGSKVGTAFTNITSALP